MTPAQLQAAGFGTRALAAIGLGIGLAGASALQAQTCQHQWSLLPIQPEIQSMTTIDLGLGPRLYANRQVTTPGGGFAKSVVRWTGAGWEEIGEHWGIVWAFEAFDEGAGPVMFAAGDFMGVGGVASRSIIRWDGAAWSPVPTGWTPQSIAYLQALCVYDDGTGAALVVGGSFPGGVGGVTSASIAKWDGTAWSGFDGGIDGNIRDMLVWDDGTGTALYIGGYFDWAGTTLARRVAKWDGQQWHALGAGICPEPANGPVWALSVYDNGAGEALYAGGTFYGACGVPGSRALARWDGSQWSAVAQVAYQFPAVTALYVFDDGVRGPGLIVGGDFTAIGGISAQRIARYDGSGWSDLGIEIASFFLYMTRFDEGPTPTLWVDAGVLVSPGVYATAGRYQYVCEPCYPDCDGSGSLTLADFGCFQTRFVAADPQADCNQSGSLTIADFGCFQTKFVIGCP